jgi:hypothetical protein
MSVPPLAASCVANDSFTAALGSDEVVMLTAPSTSSVYVGEVKLSPAASVTVTVSVVSFPPDNGPEEERTPVAELMVSGAVPDEIIQV